MHARFTSRKFIMALAAQVVALATLLWPEHSSAVSEVTTNLAALLVSILGILGYIKAEASIDREAVKK